MDESESFADSLSRATSVDNMVRDWLVSTFTRSTSRTGGYIDDRNGNKKNFKSVANVIRISIMVDRFRRSLYRISIPDNLKPFFKVFNNKFFFLSISRMIIIIIDFFFFILFNSDFAIGILIFSNFTKPALDIRYVLFVSRPCLDLEYAPVSKSDAPSWNASSTVSRLVIVSTGIPITMLSTAPMSPRAQCFT